MAEITTLTEPVTIEALDRLEQLPVGDLLDVTLLGDPDGVVSTVTNRFPTPPAGIAFLTGVDALIDAPIIPPGGLIAPYLIIGAVTPAGLYLEPTIGQIWPR